MIRVATGVCLVLAAALGGQPVATTSTIQLFLIERPVGVERVTTTTGDGGRTIASEVDLTDRGTRLQLSASLEVAADGTPRRFLARGRSYRFVNVDVTVTSDDAPAGTPWFPARSWAPVAGRAALIQYWETHGRPAEIRMVPGDADSRIRIAYRGDDRLTVGGRSVTLRRYSVDGVVWGREAVWVDGQGAFAALVSRIHILPLEAVRSDLTGALPTLQAAAIRDRMADLRGFADAAAPMVQGTFALSGARILTGRDVPPILDGTIVVRDGVIAAVGPRATTAVPDGVRVIDVTGRTIIPGLWDMHAHASQIEWGPAYLAAGVTSIRDMGGEAAFMTAFRDAVAGGGGLGPRLELAGLVDGPGERGFGTVVAGTSDEGVAVVNRYHAEGFRQIKLYSLLQPPVVAAITARAHTLGLTVTGHVPSAMTTEDAVRAGVDQIAHLSQDLPMPLMALRGTVVDPTQAWGELLGRPSNVPPTEVEPGLARTPYALAANYASVQNPPRASGGAAAPSRSAQTVRALSEQGVSIVAGTDGAVPGFSLLRELELYVQAGLTPLQAIQSATTVAARAAGRERETGTVAPGLRADLVVLDADPLADISAVRTTRFVVSQGRLYQPTALWRLAGFRD